MLGSSSPSMTARLRPDLLPQHLQLQPALLRFGDLARHLFEPRRRLGEELGVAGVEIARHGRIELRGLGPLEHVPIAIFHYPPFPAGSCESRFTSLAEEAGCRHAVYGHLHSQGEWGRFFQGEHRGIEYRLDINSLEKQSADKLAVNDIAKVSIKLAQPLAVDPYTENRATGAFIVIDESTNNTVGAGMILNAA